MQQRVVNTTPNPQVFIEVNGDLRLTGSDLAEVFAETDDDLDLSADAAGTEVKLFCSGDCTVRVPRDTRLTLGRVGGDARPIKDLAGALTIGDIGGDLVLRQTAGAQVGHVGGDISVKKIGGALTLAGAGGDVSARGVEGAFTTGFVGGDLYLRDVTGAAQGQAGGDVYLNLDFTAGQNYAFSANGDIVCRVPPTASARIAVHCNGEISLDVPGAQTADEGGQQVITLGAGAATVAFQSNGDVTLSDVTTASSGVAESGDDFGEALASQIEAQVAAKMAEVERELHAQFGDLNLNLSGLGRMNASDIAVQARRAAEAARRRSVAAQRKIEAAQRKAERLAQRHTDQAASRRRSWGFSMTLPTPPRPSAPPTDPVSNEERLTILRMLEQGKISAADAEKLLAALEGKSVG